MTAEFMDKTGRRFQIAEAVLSQLDEIEDIEKLCFSVPWSYVNLEAQATGKNKLFLCASDDSGVLGYVGLTMVLDEGYIANVAVAPRARRRGIADALLFELERRTKKQLAFLTLEVRASNAPAIKLYEKHGFAVVGRRKNYYTQPQEDALLMTFFFKKDENPC